MKRPYKLGLLALGALSIYYTILFILNLPSLDWISPSATSLAGFIYVLYLALEDSRKINECDFIDKILFVLFWLSLVLTYPKIVYEMWQDREIIRAKIREEIAKVREEKQND